MSALAYWSPVFENLDYLPNMVFPFVKVFLGDTFSGFEAVITVIVNWCQKWWEYYPNPPLECLDVLEDILAYHDKDLLDHLIRFKATSQVYGWLMIQNMFSEVLMAKDWMTVWDHFLMKDPSFMYNFAVAYLIYFRRSIMAISKAEDFKVRLENTCV